MNLNNPQSMGMPRQNSAFPMAQLRDGRDGSLYNYNQPTEVIGGYDAKINPMTGQEIPQVNFAGGGIASVLESKGRRGDTMLVHMAPEEVRGLQALALAHGGTLTVNPETGLYEASFLKKLLPTIIGATLNAFAPGVGSKVGSLFGLSGAAASTIGTGLVVGGAYGLIEGDLKKGLEAGLGAYSGANIAQSLQAASVAASQPPPVGAEELEKLKQLPKIESAARETVGATGSAPQLAAAKIRELTDPLAGKTLPGLTVSPLAEIATNKLPPLQQPSLTGGIKGLFTSPEARTSFGQALGGGFQSPFMQSMAKTATFSGLANALSPEPQQLPTGGGMGDNVVYIPGGYNPLYGTGRDQPYQLPGKYYKRTPQGLVPFNPYAMAPGGRGFADGGIVDPARDPGGNVLLPPPQTPFSPYFTNPVTDPNVAATRSYIEELNRRARTPEVRAYPGTSTGGVGGFNVPFTPYVPPTGGGGDVGGDVGGGGAAGIVGGIAGQYLAQKGIEKGIGYIKDKFFPSVDDLTGVTPAGKIPLPAEPPPITSDLTGVEVTGKRVGSPTDADLAAGRAANQATLDVPSAETIDAITKTKLGTSLPASAEGIASLKAAINATGKAALPATSTLPKADLAAKYATETAGAGTSSVAGKVIPGLQTVLGLHQAYQGISKGNEAQAAMGGFGAATGLASLGAFGSTPAIGALVGAGPIGLAAAAIAALGASMVNTKEFGDKALENYWKAVDAGRGFGQAPPEELAQGFINFYRTNKNQFAGQEKYGRTGNEDFVYDMTQVINDAVKEGKVDKNVDAATMYEKVVQPWLNSMGPGPQNEDARKIQDFMMTDLINNFMRGAPISHAQVKGDKKFKIVSEKPVYAGVPSDALLRGEMGGVYGQMPVGYQGRPGGVPEGAGREGTYIPTPFSEPQAAPPPPTPFSEPEMSIPTRPTMTPFSAPNIVEEVAPAPYSPRIIEEEPVAAAPPPMSKFSAADLGLTPAMTPFSEPEPVYYPPVMREPEPVYRREREMFSPFSEFGEGQELQFNYGGAVGEDYNFGFAQGGMPGEYQAGGKLLDGPGDGMSDDIPAVIRGKGVQRAALADGEFVIPADVVSHLGNGSTKAGAKKLYDMMARVRKARTGKANQAPAVKTARLMPA